MAKIRKKHPKMIGNVFGRLTVMEYNGINKHGRREWLCQCECGESTILPTSSLTRGLTKSCGCLRAEMMRDKQHKHGQSALRTPEYSSWKNMLSRCYNTNNPRFPLWGGRGILVCDRWRYSFENFFEDMGKKPSLKINTIDRINNNLGYYKENCKWASHAEQTRNVRSNHWIEYDGRKQILTDWANELGVYSGSSITFHLDKGKSFEWVFNYYKNKNHGNKISNT